MKKKNCKKKVNREKERKQMMGGVCFSVKGINREEKWTRKIKRRTDLFV